MAERDTCTDAVPDEDAPPSIHVLSYNIHRAVGADGIRRPARIAEVLEQHGHDIIGLQEVDWDAGTEPPSEIFIDAYGQTQGYDIVKGPNLTDHRGHYGNMLLTRLPVLGSRRIDMSVAGREPRSAIDAVVETTAGPLRVFVTHFGLNWRERRNQARCIAQRLDETPGVPAILLGDFNEWIPFAPALRPLSRRCSAPVAGATYPAAWPILRLDRILFTGYFRSYSVSALRNALTRIASDHLPVAARVRLDGPAHTR